MLVASTLRRAVVSSVALTILTSLAMAFVLTVTAGARRTDTSFARFRAASKSADVVVNVTGDDPIAIARRLDGGPGVTAAAGLMLLFTTPDVPGIVPGESANGFGGINPAFGKDVQALRILEGRAADPAAEDEITISRDLAELGGLQVGDRVPVASPGSFVEGDVTVTGIHRWEFELGGQVPFPVAIFTAAFTERWMPAYTAAGDGQPFPHFFMVRLDDPSPDGQRRFAAWVEDELGEGASVEDATRANETIRGSLQVQTVALLAVAGFALLATVLILSQAAERTISGRADDVDRLLAMGMTFGQRAAVLALPVMAAVAAGGAIAVLVAIAASTLLPVGFARTVEPSPGIRIDLPVLLPLTAVMVAVVCARSAWAARRHATAAAAIEQPKPLRIGPVSLVTARVGLQRALAGTSHVARGASRSAMVGMMVAVAGLVAVVTFTASEHRLLATPRAFGWSFDTAAFANADIDGSQASLLEQAEAMDAVDAFGTVSVGGALAKDAPVEVQSFVSELGDVHPALLRGRAATASDELVIGARISDELGYGVGDAVPMRGPSGEERPMTIVGVAVLPGIGEGEFGFAVAVSASGAEALGIEWTDRAVVAQIARNATRSDVVFEGEELGEQVDAFLPAPLLNLERAGDVPSLLAAFLAVLGVGAVSHALVVTVRRSRREAATLRCLGFVRRQIVASVAWQAAVYGAIGLAVGIPVGVLLGRAAWSVVAGGLGVVNLPTVPLARVAQIGLACIVVAIATAVVPAWTAARTSPAAALRHE